MVPKILETMEFKSNNEYHRPILEALDWIKSGDNNRRKHFNLDEPFPTEEIIKPKWYDVIVEQQKLQLDTAATWMFETYNFKS